MSDPKPERSAVPAALSASVPSSYATLIDAAARAIIAARCRACFVHEVRGGLQAINSSVELLVRAATVANTPLAEKAAGLLRKALGAQERGLIDMLSVLAPGAEEQGWLALDPLLEESVSLLRNQAARRSVQLRARAESAGRLSTGVHHARLLITGLTAECVDLLGPQTTLDVSASTIDARVRLEWKASAPLPPLPPGEDSLQFNSHYEIVASAVRLWACGAGGTLTQTADLCALRIELPQLPPPPDQAD